MASRATIDSALRTRSGTIAVELIVPVAAIALWWIVSAGSQSLYFPPLSSIMSSFYHLWLSSDILKNDVLPSLKNLAIGYAIACVLGIGLGMFLGLAPVIADAIDPILEFLRAVPGVALIPAFLLLLGIGPGTRIAIIAYGTIWPILLNTIDGVRSVDPVVRDVVRSYQIGTADRWRRVVLPAASPQIIAGMRTGLSLGITLIVFSEMEGANSGIGFQILSAQRSFAVPVMWAGMILLGVIGYLLNLAFRGFEAYALRWHRGMRQQVRS
jgi:sulfonate transport system permease protein